MIDAIICGDCLELMKQMDDESVDAIVTDPPFGIGYKYGGKKENSSSPTDYWQWFKPRYLEMSRILKLGGLLAIWQTDLYMRYFWEWYGDDIHIYIACKNWCQVRPTPINYGYDPIVMKYKEGASPLSPLSPRRSFDWFVSNTAKYLLNSSKNLATQHPCPRPLDQCLELIENFTISNGLVLDPFCGSGMILVAAKRNNRHWIGMDVSEKYCELARQTTGMEMREQGLTLSL